MLLQGAYLAHLSQLTSLWTLLDRDRSVPDEPEPIPDDLILELAAYPTSLRIIEVELADTIFVYVGSYLATCPGLRVTFRATESAHGCGVALNDAAGRLLAGQHLELEGCHDLDVHTHAASAAGSRSAATCLLDWVAQSGARSVTVQPPEHTGYGRAMTLRGLTNEAPHMHMQHISRHRLHEDLSRACGQFLLTCSNLRAGIVLRSNVASL